MPATKATKVGGVYDLRGYLLGVLIYTGFRYSGVPSWGLGFRVWGFGFRVEDFRGTSLGFIITRGNPTIFFWGGLNIAVHPALS